MRGLVIAAVFMGILRAGSAEAGFCATAPTNLLCEDFETTSLYSNTTTGLGSPTWGPAWDESGPLGIAGQRGSNWYWSARWGGGVTSSRTLLNKPVSPAHGVVCGQSECYNNVWLSGDLNGTNGTGGGQAALMGILSSAADFVSLGDTAAPSNTSSGGTGPFDGVASFAHIIPAGSVQGFVGERAYTATTHPGITLALAFPSNTQTSHINNNSGDCNWKFDESIEANGLAGYWDALAGFGDCNSGSGTNRTLFPGHGFIFGTGASGNSVAGCAAIVASKVETVGSISCDGNGTLIWDWSGASYSYPTSWPVSTWGCIRADMDFAGGRMRQWVQTTQTSGELLVFDVSGLDFSGATVYTGGGYSGYKFDAYANVNQGSGGTPTTVETYRYEDNLIITNGTPATCAQLGFVDGGRFTTISGSTVFTGRVTIQ